MKNGFTVDLERITLVQKTCHKKSHPKAGGTIFAYLCYGEYFFHAIAFFYGCFLHSYSFYGRNILHNCFFYGWFFKDC